MISERTLENKNRTTSFASGLRLTEDSDRYRCIRGILAAPPVAFVRVAPLDATKQQLRKILLIDWRDNIGLDRRLPKDISAEDFQKYVDEVNSRINVAADWIRQNMGEIARARFIDVSGALDSPRFFEYLVWAQSAITQGDVYASQTVCRLGCAGARTWAF